MWRWRPRRSAKATIITERVLMRSLEPADAESVERLAGDWSVARMLCDMPHPLSPEGARAWLDQARREGAWAIEIDSELAGVVSLFETSPSCGELGFWLGRAYWGQGLAREAAAAVLSEATRLNLFERITAGHLIDNPASGLVLSRLGFRPTHDDHAWCEARRAHVPCRRYAYAPAAVESLSGSQTGSTLFGMRAP